MAGANVYIGDRFFKKVSEDNSEDIRIKKFKGVNDVSVVTTTGKQFKISRDKLAEDYVRLIPDGQLAVSIVDTGKIDNKVTKDVLVCLYRTEDLEDGRNIPFAVCRQNIEDFFTTQINNNPYVQYAGLSMSQATCPDGVEFAMILACNGIIHTTAISVYLDDTLDDILGLINTSKFDETLKEMHDKIAYNVVGHYPSLRQLLEANEFMYDFLSAYNIHQVPFEVQLINDCELYPEQRSILEEILKTEMFRTYVLKYDRDIDINEIQRNFVMISDNNKDVYIVAFDKGQYINETYKKAFKDRRDIVAMYKNINKL